MSSGDTVTAINPCVECGACCATFRVSFYWAEADDAPGGTVPAALTGRLHAHLRVMQGTDRPEPRCCALQGEIGGKRQLRDLSPAVQYLPGLQGRLGGRRAKRGLQPRPGPAWPAPRWNLRPSAPRASLARPEASRCARAGALIYNMYTRYRFVIG